MLTDQDFSQRPPTFAVGPELFIGEMEYGDFIKVSMDNILWFQRIQAYGLFIYHYFAFADKNACQFLDFLEKTGIQFALVHIFEEEQQEIFKRYAGIADIVYSPGLSKRWPFTPGTHLSYATSPDQFLSALDSMVQSATPVSKDTFIATIRSYHGR